MKNLTPRIWEKAVEIANALLRQGESEEKVIPIAIAKAQEWGSKRAYRLKIVTVSIVLSLFATGVLVQSIYLVSPP